MSRSLYARLAHRFADRRRTMTRREALKASAAGFAAVLAATRLGGCASDRSARMDAGRPARRPNGKSVIVVGAGFAGLACAYELLEFGYEVEVIEARDRIGGRVLSFKDFVPGKVVEGGAELIGSNHFTWQAYAQQFGLRMLDVTTEDELAFPIRLNGRMLDEREAERLWYAMDAALSTMNDAAVPISAEEPWNSPGATDLDRDTVSGWIEGLDADDATKQVLRVVLASDNAVPVENQSLLGMLAQVAGGGGQAYWEDSEVYRCRGGNQQLADKLLDRIQGYRVLRGTPVASIEYESVAKVTLADGRVRAADYVVLAVPPSVWTRIFFVPLLPDRLAPQMGTALKYLSAVKSRYWRDLGLAPDSLTDGPVAMTWNGTDNQGGGNASLHVFSGGSAAQWLREGTRQEVDARVTRELESIYPGYEANLLAEARGGPRRFMDWPGDEWCRGGYSFPAPGQLTRTGPILHEGIHRLRFCGEHTCPAFVGYMEGALRSGVLLAQRMALGDGSVAMPERMAAGV